MPYPYPCCKELQVFFTGQTALRRQLNGEISPPIWHVGKQQRCELENLQRLNEIELRFRPEPYLGDIVRRDVGEGVVDFDQDWTCLSRGIEGLQQVEPIVSAMQQALLQEEEIC